RWRASGTPEREHGIAADGSRRTVSGDGASEESACQRWHGLPASRRCRGARPRGQGGGRVIHSRTQARTISITASVFVICLLECGLLFGRRFALIFRTPFVIWHAVDRLPALVLR